MDTKRKYQGKLAAKMYAILNNGNEDNLSAHTTQYKERVEMHRGMEENGKGTNWHELTMNKRDEVHRK